MTVCINCGKPIVGDYYLSLVEKFKGEDVWTYDFHGWTCLVQFLVSRGKIVAEVIVCD